MRYQTPEYRLAIMASRLKQVIRGANLQDGEFITLRVSITDREGSLLKWCKLTEFNELASHTGAS